MPPLDALTDAQIAGVMTYVRREWGHEAAAVDAATVARIRESTKGRAQAWTEAELKRIK